MMLTSMGQPLNWMAACNAPLSRLAVLFLCCLLAGCTTPAPTPTPATASAPDARRADPPNLSLLYLLGTPHSRIHVEVDAVEGCAPTDHALHELKTFLAAHCHKTNAVEVARSDIIPGEAARGASPRALARRYLNGPTKDTAAPGAFIYVLYYSYPLSRDSSPDKILHRGASIVPVARSQTAAPFAETYPYPAIYFNSDFSLGLALNEILLHETGHLLGLVDRSRHARGGHCLNRGCQMNDHSTYLRQFRWLPGRRQGSLCADCTAELATRRTQPAPRNVRYVGPVLVRSETDYHVIGLPGRSSVIVGQLTDADCEEFTRVMRADTTSSDEWRLHCLLKPDALDDPARLGAVRDRFKADPDGQVRNVAPRLLYRASAAAYHARGRFTNAVHSLQEAIRLHPQDASSHNQLAWLQATCPDASIRNASAAIASASKACELTGWNNPRYLDTLAAACAEAGDFKRAVQLQKQALRSRRDRADATSLRTRLTLYQRSQPFRDKPPGRD